MQLKKITAHENWQNRLENIGFGYHTDEKNQPYWIEDYYYSITEKEADQLFEATNELWKLVKCEDMKCIF